MTTNLHAPGSEYSLSDYVNAAVTNSSTANISYPDASVCLYVKAAVAAGTYKVPGAPSLEVAELMHAALGA
jgi:hypothetical protein